MQACPVQEMYRKGRQADPAGARQRLITDINEVRRPCSSVLNLNSAVSPHACIDVSSCCTPMTPATAAQAAAVASRRAETSRFLSEPRHYYLDVQIGGAATMRRFRDLVAAQAADAPAAAANPSRRGVARRQAAGK